MRKGYIYYLYSGCLKKGTIKIGKTIDVIGRRSAYKTYYGQKVKGFVFDSEDIDYDETMIKKECDEWKESGELYVFRHTDMKEFMKTLTGSKAKDINKIKSVRIKRRPQQYAITKGSAPIQKKSSSN